MGTRCLTTFVDDHNGKEIVVLYRQFDGYPEGHGAELQQAFGKCQIGNGRIDAEPHAYANGMGCLAAQVIAHFKTENGGFYLYPAETREVGEEFVYSLSSRNGQLWLEVYDGPITFFGAGGEDCTNQIYNGPLTAYETTTEAA